MKGDHGPTKLLHALTWGAFDHKSHAFQVRACNYYIHVHVHVLYLYFSVSGIVVFFNLLCLID